MKIRSILGLGKKKEKEEKADDKILSEGDAENILNKRTADPPEPQKEEPEEIEEIPETIILTSAELGDIFGDKEIVSKTDDVCAYIQKVEVDPSTGARSYAREKYMGDEHAMLPLNKKEMMQFLPPGKYLVRILDANKKGVQFGSVTVDIPIPVKQPAEGEVGASATEMSLEMSRITKENEELKLEANKKPDLGDKALDILFTIATEKLTGKGNDKGIDLTEVVSQVTKAIIEGNAAHNTATNEILSARENHRSQYDLESLKYTHEKDLLKLKKQIEDGTITPDEAQKSSNKIAETIGKIFDGVSKVVKDIQGPLQTLKEIQELNVMKATDETTPKTQPETPTEHAPGKEEDMSEIEGQTPEMPGYYTTESEGGEFITPDMEGYDERRDPTSENYDPLYDPTQPEYVPQPTEDQTRTSKETPDEPLATGTPDIPVQSTPAPPADEKDGSQPVQESVQEDKKKDQPPQK
jgi:hypothetical protein